MDMKNQKNKCICPTNYDGGFQTSPYIVGDAVLICLKNSSLRQSVSAILSQFPTQTSIVKTA
jgi:hypothetical protein